MTGEPDLNGSELTRAGSLGTLIGADLAGRLHDRSDVCQSSSDVEQCVSVTSWAAARKFAV